MRALTRFYLVFFCSLLCSPVAAQPSGIPAVYEGLAPDASGRLTYQTPDGLKLTERTPGPRYTLTQMRGGIRGTANGLAFDFKDDSLNGRLYFGLIDTQEPRFPLPVFFKHFAKIEAGEAKIDIAGELSGKYDMTGWEASGRGLLGYRVVRADGQFLYDGKINFEGPGPFRVATSILEGPMLAKTTPEGATVRFVTNTPVRAKVEVQRPGGQARQFRDEEPVTLHEITIEGLQPDTDYRYHVAYGDNRSGHTLHTAPRPGSRTSFRFAYCSDSRAGEGGGERNIFGTNAYIMKRIYALARQETARFMQFSGDLVNGYQTSAKDIRLQYANWKRAIDPFAAEMPSYISMGNHEALVHEFVDPNGQRRISIDRFPFATASAEAVFADEFTNPEGDLSSEDGADYDPNPNQTDFPSYKENVFAYTYDNIAMIVLNTDYLYSPGLARNGYIGGNIHGYLLDQQMAWLERKLAAFEADGNIDHVFVTQHTPAFPNGGHASDDMWYHGDNRKRPIIAGQKLEEGIIERRDAYLDLLVNQSTKVRAILTGDEHNYNRLKLTSAVPRYPEDWDGKRLELSRPLWQINNGAAGAPYYAQEDLPWSNKLSIFSTQNALILFHVKGQRLEAVVKNPVTLEEIDRLVLSE